MKRIALVLGVMMILAMSAPADLVVVVDPGVDIGGGLTSYTVRMVADSPADQLGAFDGSFQGVMNQIKAFGVLDTPTLTHVASLTPDEQARDTHFLLADADLISVTSPNETPSLLNGVFAVAVDAREQDLAFAQIVLPEGETVQLTGEVANAIGMVFNIGTLGSGVTDPVGVMVFPEPTTVSLLSVGVVLILRRRKPCQRPNASG